MYNSFCLKYWGGERIPSPLNKIFGGELAPPAPQDRRLCISIIQLLQYVSHRLVKSIKVYAENTGTELPAGLSHLHEGIKLSQTAAVWALLAQRRHRIAY